MINNKNTINCGFSTKLIFSHVVETQEDKTC